MALFSGVYSFLLYCVICLLNGHTVETTSDKIVCPDSKCELAINPFDITQNDALNGLKNSKNFKTESGDMFKDISDDSNIKKVSEIHDNGFYTSLCWIEITTITETKNGSKSAIREYAITFETPSDIPDKYVSNKTKLDGEESVQYKIFDRDTKKSEIVNFTTISRSEDNVVRQNRKVLCGSGPIYTKEFMEWPHSERKRVEIRVSPKKQNLIATDCVGMNATLQKFSTSLPSRKDFTGQDFDENSPSDSGEMKSSKTPFPFSQPAADSSRERTMLSDEAPEVTAQQKTAYKKQPSAKTTPHSYLSTKSKTEVTSEKSMSGVTKVISALQGERNKQTPGTLQSKVKYGTVDSTRSSIRPQPTKIATTTKSPSHPSLKDESNQDFIISTEKAKDGDTATDMPHKVEDESITTEETSPVKYNPKSILESTSTTDNDLFTDDGSSLKSEQGKLQNKHATTTPEHEITSITPSEGTSKFYSHTVGRVPSKSSSHAKKVLVPNRKINQHKHLSTSTTEVISDISVPSYGKSSQGKISKDNFVTTETQNTLKDESIGADSENIKGTDLQLTPSGRATTTEGVKIPKLKEKAGEDDDVEYYYFDFTEPPNEEHVVQGGDKVQIQTTTTPTMKPKLGYRSTVSVSLPTTLLGQEESTQSHLPLFTNTFNTLHTKKSGQLKTTLRQHVTSKSSKTHLKDVRTEEYPPEDITVTGKVPADEKVSQMTEYSTAANLESRTTEVPTSSEVIKIIKGKSKISKFSNKEQTTQGKYAHPSTEATSLSSKKGKVYHKQPPTEVTTEIHSKKVDDNATSDKNIHLTTQASANKSTTSAYQTSIRLDQKIREPESTFKESSDKAAGDITTQEFYSSSSETPIRTISPDGEKLKLKDHDTKKGIVPSTTSNLHNATSKDNFEDSSIHKQGSAKQASGEKLISPTTPSSNARAVEIIVHGKPKHLDKGVTVVPVKETSPSLLNKNAETTTTSGKSTTQYKEFTSGVSIEKISSKHTQYTTDASKSISKGASTQSTTEKPLQDQTENVKEGMFTITGVKKHHGKGRHPPKGHRGGMKSTTLKPLQTTETSEAIYLQSSPHISKGHPILSDNLKHAFRTTALLTERPGTVTTEADQNMQSFITELPYPENDSEKQEGNTFTSEGEKTGKTTATSHFTTPSLKKLVASTNIVDLHGSATTKRSKLLEHGISTTTIQSLHKHSGSDVEVSPNASTDTNAPSRAPSRKALRTQSPSPNIFANTKRTKKPITPGGPFESGTSSTISPVSRTSPHSQKYSTSSSGYIVTGVPSRSRSSKINILSQLTKKPKNFFVSLKPPLDASIVKSSTSKSIIIDSHRSSTGASVLPEIKTSKEQDLLKEILQTSTSKSLANQAFTTQPDMDVATTTTTTDKFVTADGVTKEPGTEDITNTFFELSSHKPPIFKSRGRPVDGGTTESGDKLLNPLREFDYLCNASQQRVLVKVKLLMEHVLAVNENGSQYEKAIPVIGLEKKAEFDINPLSDDDEEDVPSQVLSEHWEQFLDDLTQNFFSTNRDKIPKYSDLPSRTLNVSAPEYDFKGTTVNADESFKRMQNIKNSMRRCSNRTSENSQFVAKPQFRMDNLFAPVQEKQSTFTTTFQNLQNRIEVQNPQENPDFYKFLLGLQPAESTKRESSYDSINVVPTKSSYLRDSNGNGYNLLQGRDHIINRENYGYTPVYGRYREHQPILYTNAFAFPQQFNTFDSLPSNEHPILGIKPKVYQANAPMRSRNDYSFLKNFGPQPQQQPQPQPQQQPQLQPQPLKPNVAPKSVYYESPTTTKVNPNIFMGLKSASGYGRTFKRQTTEPQIPLLKETGKFLVPKFEANKEISYNTGSLSPLFVPQKTKQVRQSISPSNEKYAAFRWEDVESAANRALFNISNQDSKSEAVTSSVTDFSTILNAIVEKLSSLLNKLSSR